MAPSATSSPQQPPARDDRDHDHRPEPVTPGKPARDSGPRDDRHHRASTSPDAEPPARRTGSDDDDDNDDHDDDGAPGSDGDDVSSSGSRSPGEVTDRSGSGAEGLSPLPPLPSEPAPEPHDDGWDCHWDQGTQAWFFHNRYTNQTTWENPRVPTGDAVASASNQPQPPSAPGAPEAPGAPAAAAGAAAPAPAGPPPAGGYNPAIHGDYDPNAWYAKQGGGGGGGDSTAGEAGGAQTDAAALLADPAALYAATASFNRFTGSFQSLDRDGGPGRHSDEAKSRRQMNAFFDVDAAANAHDGRSLKAERSGKKPTKAELKAFKEKRRAKKEEKRRAWLRD